MNDLDQLGSASRALLDAARSGITPDAARIARVRAKVDTAVAAGAGAGITSMFASKLGVLVVAAVVATGAVVYTVRDRAPAVTEPIAFQAAMVESPTRTTVHEPEVGGRAPIAMPPMDVSSQKPDAAKPDAAKPDAAKVVSPKTHKKLPAIDLAREVELIDAAMAAMRRGDAQAALVSVRTHATETAGAGQLAEDAAAIEVEALCSLKDAAVAAKLTAFDARWPDSAQRSRLTTACK